MLENVTMQDQLFMRRAIEIAGKGLGLASPNPTVGAVIVYQNRIIGEGYHKKYGKAHAEVNALNKVNSADKHLIKESTIYISLEPCCIFGNTAPCTQTIIEHKIPRVFISNVDLTNGVAGKGINILRDAGCEVVIDLLKEEGKKRANHRNIFVKEKRPYIILKFAQSKDGFMAKENESVWFTNHYSKRLVHKWRNEIDAILVGTNTAKIDNPQLTNRLYFGKSPIRIVLDKQLKLPLSLKIFNTEAKTIIVTDKSPPNVYPTHLQYLQIDFNEELLTNLLSKLAEQKIGVLMVEGGIQSLQSFLDHELWDEARVFIGDKLIGTGLAAPIINQTAFEEYHLDADMLRIYHNDRLND